MGRVTIDICMSDTLCDTSDILCDTCICIPIIFVNCMVKDLEISMSF